MFLTNRKRGYIHDKMFKRNPMHNQNVFINKYNFPKSKIDIFCPFCNKEFQLKDQFTVASPSTPLLLSCGHPICSLCALKRSNRQIVCKVCNKKHECDESESNKFPPVNVYLIGLLRCLENRIQVVQKKQELEFSFQQALESKLEQKLQGRCTDCRFAATCRCIQCENNLFCDSCYMRIHQTALKGHERVDLPDALKMPGTQFCKMHKCYQEYFCIDCDVDGCSHCLIVGHSGSGHKIIHLREKNEEYINEYNLMGKLATDRFNRLKQSEKILEEISTTPEGFDSIENEINERYIYLHGLLQNTKAEMLKDLHSYREDYAQQIENLRKKVLMYRTALQDALMDVHVVNHTNMEQVNLKEIIDKLKTLSDVPSCVIKSANYDAEAIKLVYDDSIIEAIENQCQIEFFDTVSYRLCCEEDVPAEYALPPPQMDNDIRTIMNGSIETEVETEVSPLSPYLSLGVNSECDASSIKDDENDDLETTMGLSPDSSDKFMKSEMEVKVLHIENPSTFYVVETKNLESYENTQAQVQKHGKKSRGKLSEAVIDKNTRCIAKDKDGVWHRARVLQVTTNHNLDKLVKVYMYDCGKKLELPVSNIKKMTSQLESLPEVLIETGLKDIEPVNGSWTENAKIAMTAIINRPGVNLLCIECAEGPKLIGELKHMPKDGSNPNYVRQELVFNGHGTWIRSDRLQRTNPNSCVRKLFHEDLTLQNFTAVKCTFIENAWTMYVQKTEQMNVDFLKKLELELFMECNTANKSLQIHVPEIGMLCAIPGGLKGEWARGRITGIPGKKMVEVFLVDIGISRRVQCDCIRRLPARFMTSRTQAIKIQLKGVKPISMEASAKAKKFLINQLNQKEFSVVAYQKLEFDSEKNENNFYRCTVYIGNNINLNQVLGQAKLVEYEGSEPPLKNIPEQFLEDELCDNQTEPSNLPGSTTGNTTSMLSVVKKATKNESKKVTKKSKKEDPFKIEVRIVKVESPDSIYVSDISRQKEFEKLKYDMHEYYKDKQCISEDGFKKGDSCAVYSPKDKTHLRARVVEVLPAEKVVVFFYDLAVTDEVDMDYLHNLQEKRFAAFPFYSFRVKLSGISPCGGGKHVWPQTTNDKLHEKIQANLNSKFFIEKVGSTDENDTIPVILTVQRSKIVDPLLPTRIETESISQYLIDEGVALPNKGTETNQIKTLAIELKKELVMYQPTFNEDHHRWNKSKLSRQVCEEDDEDSDDDCSLEVCTQLTDIDLPPENADWLPPVDIEFDQFEATPTYIDYGGNVFFHLIEQKSNLDLIKMTIDKTYKNAYKESCDSEWRIGEVCMVRYKHDQCWYRGRIVGKKSFYYEVHFIDYGNTEIVHPDHLKKRVILLDMPAQATVCEIQGLVPENKKFSTKELDMIHQTMVNYISIFTVLQRPNDKLICSIFMKKNGKNLVDHVANDLHIPLGVPNSLEQNGQSSFTSSSGGSFESNFNELKTEDDDDPDVVIEEYNCVSEKVSIDDDEKNDTSDDEASLEYNELELENILDTDTLQVEITSFVSCTEFIARLLANKHSKRLSEMFKKYTAIMKDLENVAEFQPVMTSAQVGLPCCAKYTDDKWYRAKIIDVLPDQENCVMVKYVDFGNENPCPIEWLREIDAKWLQVPPLAINCKLWNIRNSKNVVGNDAFVKRFSELVESRKLYAKLKEASGNQIKAELYTDKKCVNLVYASLIEDGFLSFSYTFK